MTETAVVTEFSVGDMWKRLPEYADAASDLGSSIKDVYAATTLYYQQGLKTEAAMGVGIETMKMARIAGMEASDATNAMTAALRGFNMEVNETNAQKVNDVYSNLAALSASNVEQISTAMSKTASIASAANMEFETTAALLAQIIETTQEAPETAGTALKTIIARFSEVKSLQSQGQSTGEDEEGETIDVNKIDKALKSVGISMDGFFAGTEGLDSVLMKLAEKWDTLDFTTQRYIATMAAGSRQQSRFIAMMSDYERTTQLVGIANNSADASQKQFNKTMESLEAKLNKLKVAWDQFTMNIANNSLIKAGVDILTGLLNVINKLTGWMPGLVGSFANLALVFGALRIGGALLQKALTGISVAIVSGVKSAAPAAEGAATETGIRAGAAMTRGTALGVNDPAAQASIIKSYNLLVAKLQYTIPPVRIRTAVATTPADLQSLEALRTKMGQVAATAGVQSKEYQQLRIQYKQMVASTATAAGGYYLEGEAAQGLTIKQNQLLASKVAEGKITEKQIMLLGPEAAARVADALAAGAEEEEIEDLCWAKQTETNLRNGGIIGLLTEIGLRVMGVGAIQKEKGGLKALIVEKWNDFKAQMARNSAMLIGLGIALAVVAVLALVVVAIIKVTQAIKEASDSSKDVARLNEEISLMQKEVERASKAMEELTQQQSSLEEMQDTFAGLTKGTRAWREQLLKINSTVLELINKYPEMAGHIIRDEDGALTVSEEGWDVMLDSAQRQLELAQQSQIGLQMERANLQEKLAFEKAQSNFDQSLYKTERYLQSKEGLEASESVGAAVGGATVGFLGLKYGAALGAKIGTSIGTAISPGVGTAIGAVGGVIIGALAGGLGGKLIHKGVDLLNGNEESITEQITGGMTRDEYVSFAAAAADKGVTFTGGSEEEDFHSIYSQMGFDESEWKKVWSKMRQLGPEFDELGLSTAALEESQRVYIRTLLDSVVQSDPGLQNHQFMEQATEAQVFNFENIDADIESAKTDILEDKEYVKDGDAQDKLIQEYAIAQKVSEDEVRARIKAEELSVETMAQVLAQKQVSDEIADATKTTADELYRLSQSANGSKDNFDALSRVLSTSGKKMTKEDQKKLQQTTGKTIEELISLNKTDPNSAKQILENFLKSIDSNTSLEALNLNPETILTNWQASVNDYARGDQIAASLGITEQERGAIAAVESGAYEKIFENLQAWAKQGNLSEDETKSLYNDIIKMLPKDTEQLQTFGQVLSSIDGNSLESIKTFSNDLEEMGVICEGGSTALEEFEQRLIEINNASRGLDSAQAVATIAQLQTAMDSLMTTGRETIDKETYDKLDDADKELFVEDATTGEYVFKGEGQTGKTLAQVLEQSQTDARYDSAQAAVDEVVEAEQATERTKQNSTTVTTTTVTGSARDLTYGDSTAAELLIEQAAGEEYELSEDTTMNDLYENWKAGRKYIEGYNATADNSYARFLLDNGVLEGGGTALETLYGQNVTYKTSEDGTVTAEVNEAGIKEGWDKALEQSYEDYVADQKVKGNVAADWEDYALMFSYENVFGQYTPGQQATTTTVQDMTYDQVYAGLKGGNITIGSGGSLEGTTIEFQQLKDFYVAQSGIDPTDADNMTSDQILEAMTQYHNTYIAGKQGLDAAVVGYKKDFEKKYMTLDSQELGQTVAHTKTEQEAKSTAINAQITQEGLSTRQKELEDQNKNKQKDLQMTDEQLKLLVLSENEYAQILNRVASAMENESKALVKSKRGTTEYSKALTKFKNILNSNFGLQIDDAFMKENRELVEQIMKGGEEGVRAYEKLMSKAADKNFEKMGKSKEEIEKINTALEALPDEVGVLVTAQTAGFDQLGSQVADVQGQLVLTSDAADALRTKLEGEGKTVSFKWETFYQGVDGKLYKNKPIGTEYSEVKVATSYSYIDQGTGNNPLEDLGGGGKGGGSKWSNSHDKFYNSYEEINKLLREREQIERRYDKLLKNRGVTAKELIDLTKEELANLEAQRQEQEIIKQGKAKQIEDLTNSKKGKKYSQYYTYDEKTGEINIDWDKVNKLKGSKGEGFDEFLSELEGLRDQWRDAEDALFDIEDAVQDILEQGKEEYVNLETRIKDALVDQRQREIDKLSEINDSINDTNSKLLDSMQKQIDEYRQNRDNQKTEEEIADKQRRLAYLQQDTSGANAAEILQLQKEIDEAQEDYTDTLIDQKISELQDQNDQAAEQRQRQIDLMEQQLQHWQDSGEIWKKVYELINEQSLDGGVSAEVLDLLKTADGFSGLSDVQKMDWLKELEGDVAQALDWLNTGAFKTLYQEDDTVQFTTKDGKVLSGTVDKQGNVVVEDEEGNQSLYSGSNISMDANGKLISSQTEEEARKAWLDSQKPEWPENLPKPSTVTGTIKKGSSKAAVKGVQTALTQLGYDEVGKIDGDYGSKTTTAVKHFQKDEGATNPSGNVGTWTKEKFKLHEYKTGGLADFTGPAWLDGTRSRPEYILNADQTKAFFNLIDVLGSLRDGDSKTAQNNGDNNYDIDINIESIGSDYDVEQLATKVKSLINEDARYRNNNAVNLMR